MAEKGSPNKLNGKVIFYTCLVVLFGAAFVVCVSMMVRDYMVQKEAERQFAEMAQNATVITTEVETEIPTETEEPSIIETLGIEIPQLALDWEDLKEQNEDIYSWIYVPNTNVNYPVLQHPTEHDYYLEYNLDHSKGRPGCIYAQRYNTDTYMDANTVLYGHNMKNGTMFKTLHYYEEEEFFNENRYFYIYTPDSVLVYEVYAVTEFSNEHILFKYDFSEEGGITEYIEDIIAMNDDSSNNHYVEDSVVTEEDKLVTLSTCIYGRSQDRWLVIGRLLAEEEMTYELPVETETEGTEAGE